MTISRTLPTVCGPRRRRNSDGSLKDGVERFQLPYRDLDTGYGHSSRQVEAFGMFEGEPLLGYYRSVHQFSDGILGTLQDDDFDKVVDKRWDTPVTAGVRLVSVLNETSKHLGQSEFIQGIPRTRAEY